MGDAPLDAVLLDRDGVLNRNRSDYVTNVDQWHWLPGAVAGCRALAGMGLRMAVVTNQSAVGRGLLSVAGLERIHQRMVADLAAAGVPRPVVVYCPHVPGGGCECRKPKAGLLRRAVAELAAAPERTLLVGDHDSDLAAAEAQGCWSLHVRSGRGGPGRPRVGYLGSVPALRHAAELVRALAAAGWVAGPRPTSKEESA
ncbi:D-glycero-alpha-D-manno-heptose-1,7-bisphosphate 7-phosphatase [Saccharopolyspora sp. 5N708]|uniref:D-glycero-alpha-D-manno-heptose-1,7-bisphosphate 7-phosphatase n=1 Tax=Saccharopolyspora sp. 5N708 TaxID=3457424 RepID=UPI003FD095FA